MLLRSSSTPLLGSLLSSVSESPNNFDLHAATPKHAPSPVHHNNSGKLISCNNSNNNGGGSHKSLMGSPSVVEKGFRRVQSEGNLEELANDAYNVDEFSFSNHYAKKFARKTNQRLLEPILSFSHHRLGAAYDSDEEESSEEEVEEEEDVDSSLRVEDLVMDEVRKNGRGGYGNLGFESEGKMYLAAGIGVSGFSGFLDDGGHGGRGGGGGGGSYRPVAFHKDGGDNSGVSMEEHYKKMLEGNPGNPLFLRNYAHFLYQTKGDLRGAEEYYSRAILADPEDGEILSQYAKLIWELHHDQERAQNYFQRAVRVSSEDSHIHAAYASFLWDLEDDEEDTEEYAAENTRLGQQPLVHHGFMASATA